jgi:hypothetical protein
MHCGEDIEVSEPDKATTARVRAFGPLLDRARALRASFDDFPAAHVRVTTQQLISVIVDADLPGRVVELIQFAHNVKDLDLEDPAVIGGETRRSIGRTLDEVERVRDETRLLAAFSTDSQLAELPLLLTGLAARGASVVETVIEVLAAPSLSDASSAAGRLQDSLEPPRQAERIVALLDEAPDLAGTDDTDARISVALGRDGTYTDELGLPDPLLIFAPLPGERSSLSSLARGAGSYLAHLLDTPCEQLEDAHALLALCAVPLALVNRPFEHHRRAELVRALIRQASEREPEALSDALTIYEEHAGQAFETAMRIRRQLRLVQAGALESPIEVVETAVEVYRRFAESLSGRRAVFVGDPGRRREHRAACQYAAFGRNRGSDRRMAHRAGTIASGGGRAGSPQRGGPRGIPRRPGHS